MRAIPITAAALTLVAIALNATPASAARVPVPRLDTGRVVQLRLADRATSALPASATAGALDDAMARMRARLDEVAEAAVAQRAARAQVKECLQAAGQGAVEQLAQSYAAGSPADMNELMYSAAVPCFASPFPDAVGARVEQFAQAAAGHANEVAYEELSDTGSSAPATYGGGYDDGSSRSSDGEGGAGGAIAIGVLLLVVVTGAGIVIFFARGRRI